MFEHLQGHKNKKGDSSKTKEWTMYGKGGKKWGGVHDAVSIQQCSAPSSPLYVWIAHNHLLGCWMEYIFVMLLVARKSQIGTCILKSFNIHCLSFRYWGELHSLTWIKPRPIIILTIAIRVWKCMEVCKRRKPRRSERRKIPHAYNYNCDSPGQHNHYLYHPKLYSDRADL